MNGHATHTILLMLFTIDMVSDSLHPNHPYKQSSVPCPSAGFTAGAATF